MNLILVALAVTYLLVLLALFCIEIYFRPKDLFSAGRVFLYFSFLSWLPLIYFACNEKALNEVIFSSVANEYQDIDLVYISYIAYIFSIIIFFGGICAGLRPNHQASFFLMNKIFALRTLSANDGIKRERKVVRVSLFMLLVGTGIYVIFIFKMGGLAEIWANLGNRQVMSAGLGYFQTFYVFTVTFGTLLISSILLRKRRYIFFSFILIFSFFILASVGQRGPIIALIFSLAIVYHYTCKKLNGLFSFKNIFAIVGLLLFFILSVQFRKDDAIEKYSSDPPQLFHDALASVERQVIGRLGRIERDVVIFGYFDRHDYWYGSSYFSVLVAPIPRGIFEEKPPVDTGRYLVAMARGEIINPPVPTKDLPTYGWPDGNMAGYMNFSWVGFFIAYFASGLFFGFLYAYVKYSNYSLGVVGLYALFSWYAGITLSPMGIVGMLTTFLWFIVWSFIYRFKLR